MNNLGSERIIQHVRNSMRNLTDNVYDKLDKNHKALTVFIDLKKAFDIISQSTLIDKLSKIGISGKCLDLQRNYIENRQQKTFINNEIPDTRKIIYGIPQGSRLSPLLYTISK